MNYEEVKKWVEGNVRYRSLLFAICQAEFWKNMAEKNYIMAKEYQKLMEQLFPREEKTNPEIRPISDTLN